MRTTAGHKTQVTGHKPEGINTKDTKFGTAKDTKLVFSINFVNFSCKTL